MNHRIKYLKNKRINKFFALLKATCPQTKETIRGEIAELNRDISRLEDRIPILQA